MPLQQLLGQNTGCGSVSLSGVSLTGPWSGSVTPQNFFFYSNNPEPITNQIADDGYYLDYASLYGGPGQVYYWHINNTGGTINSAIYLSNPNLSDVIVTVWSRGIVPLQAPSNVEAWFQYYTPGQGQNVVVPANGYALLYPQSVPNGAIFGGVLNMSIGSPGSTIPLDVFDIVYRSIDTISFLALADKDGSSRRRGTGNGYQATLNVTFDLLTVARYGPFGFTIGSPDDSIGAPSGADLVTITDAGDGRMEALGGNYGVQYYLAWTVSNADSLAHTFTFYGGNFNTGGASGTNFMINYAPSGSGLGGCRNPNPLLLPGKYLAFLRDTIQPLGSVLYNFRLGTIGAFSYPLTLAVGVDS